MAGRLLSRVTRSSGLLAARGQIRNAHQASAIPAALRDEYYPKIGRFQLYHTIQHYHHHHHHKRKD